MSDPTAQRKPEEPALRPHSYDGIQEFDQRLPNWWLFTLYIMIAFTGVYWLAFFQLGLLDGDADRIDARVAAIRAFKPSGMAMLSASDADIELWKMSRDSAHVAKGKETFDLICSACHARDLSAKLNGVPLPGLPLNDAEWKYGNKPSDIIKIVTKGSPDLTKGMVPWEPQIGATKCADVVAYVLSHHEPPAGLLKPEPGTPAPTAAN